MSSQANYRNQLISLEIDAYDGKRLAQTAHSKTHHFEGYEFINDRVLVCPDEIGENIMFPKLWLVLGME